MNELPCGCRATDRRSGVTRPRSQSKRLGVVPLHLCRSGNDRHAYLPGQTPCVASSGNDVRHGAPTPPQLRLSSVLRGWRCAALLGCAHRRWPCGRGILVGGRCGDQTQPQPGARAPRSGAVIGERRNACAIVAGPHVPEVEPLAEPATAGVPERRRATTPGRKAERVRAGSEPVGCGDRPPSICVVGRVGGSRSATGPRPY